MHLLAWLIIIVVGTLAGSAGVFGLWLLWGALCDALKWFIES